MFDMNVFQLDAWEVERKKFVVPIINENFLTAVKLFYIFGVLEKNENFLTMKFSNLRYM